MPVWEGVSFSLAAGQVAFLTGPNGAGKSTLFRCLAGWLEPDAGEILVAGEPFTGRTRLVPGTLSFVPDVPAFYDDLTAIEHLELVLASNHAEDAQPRAERLLERFGLAGQERLPPSAYSRGMREKLALVLALTLRPRRAAARRAARPARSRGLAHALQELAAAAHMGTAVLLSCHHDVPGLAPDVLVRAA